MDARYEEDSGDGLENDKNNNENTNETNENVEINAMQNLEIENSELEDVDVEAIAPMTEYESTNAAKQSSSSDSDAPQHNQNNNHLKLISQSNKFTVECSNMEDKFTKLLIQPFVVIVSILVVSFSFEVMVSCSLVVGQFSTENN